MNGAVIELRGRRAQLLAARLLVAGEVGVATGDLIDSIWPTAARPPTARQQGCSHNSARDVYVDTSRLPFFELLTQQQEEYDRAITGQIDAQTALDSIARFQQQLLEDAGLIQ